MERRIDPIQNWSERSILLTNFDAVYRDVLIDPPRRANDILFYDFICRFHIAARGEKGKKKNRKRKTPGRVYLNIRPPLKGLARVAQQLWFLTIKERSNSEGTGGGGEERVNSFSKFDRSEMAESISP